MELSKKVAYLKGLMAGLKISDDTPEGQVLLCMSDILEQMADEIEENSRAVGAITDYIDELEEGGDPFDDIDTYEYGFDPEEGEDEEEEYAEEEEEQPAEEKAEDISEPAPKAASADRQSEADRFNELLNNITSDPDYTDDDIKSAGTLVDTLKDMVNKELAQDKVSDDPAEDKESLIEKLAEIAHTSYTGDDEDEGYDDEDDDDEMIFGMSCPFCHTDITFTDKDIVNGEFGCPACGNRLTIMM